MLQLYAITMNMPVCPGEDIYFNSQHKTWYTQYNVYNLKYSNIYNTSYYTDT